MSALATHPIVFFIALLGLCASYLQGSARKLQNVSRAVDEVRQLGLSPATPFAVATIVTELGGSALILSGYYRWFGALWLAGFTLTATFAANRFWEHSMPERLPIENTFLEHLGLIGGFILVAWYDLKSG
jgi:uncharacterized membrane protein YphA (DoxX/SURF4 family)